MKSVLLSRSAFSCILILLLSLFTQAMYSQTTPTQTVSTPSVITQSSTAFSSVQIVQSVQLSGNATWYGGSLVDTGTVSLIASANGSSQMQLNLATTGQRTETQTGTGTNADCQWAGADGVAHEVSPFNCLRPALWFLPSLSLQPSVLTRQTTITDLGAGTVGSSSDVYHHLQSSLVQSGLHGVPIPATTQRSMIDLGLNPSTLLPAVLAYTVLADNGAQLPIAMEIHYSNYRAINGVQIPFLIERYVNGTLQLAIQVTSAVIN